MRKTSGLLTRFPLVRDIGALFSGSAVSSIVALAAVPIIARLFTPEHFGVAAFFVSTLVIAGPIATLCYDRAIVLPEDDGAAVQLISLASICLLAFTVVSMVLVLAGPLVSEIIASFLAPLGNWAILLPPGVLTLGLIGVGEQWAIRMKMFGRVAKADVARSLAMPMVRISWGSILGSSIGGLIAGFYFSLIIKLAVLLKHAPVERVRTQLRGRPLDLGSIGRTYKDFPLYNAPARFVRLFSTHLPVFAFGVMFSPVIAGLYAMANRLLGGPADMVSSAVRQVYIQRAAALHAKNKPLDSLYLRATAAMALLGLPLFALLLGFGQDIIVLLLGEHWSEAGVYAQVLAPWLLIVWVSTPSAALYVVLGKQGYWLSSQLALAGFRIGALAFSHINDASPSETLKLFVWVSVIINVLIVIFMFRIVMNDTKLKRT